MTTRFAPSPTGFLHLGHAYAALLAHQRARDAGGSFLLRFEDIDHTRVREEYYLQIESDLRWLGLTWDLTPWRQLDRLPHYEQALDHLKSLGVVYPCFCTRREIESELANLTRAPQGPEGPLYPGTCRSLTPDQRADLLSKKSPSWRLDSQLAAQKAGPLTFRDTIHGQTTVSPTLLGDVILARKDIGTSYHLAVVTDDAAQNITLITRGQDLLPSTHIHRLLQHLLNLPQPTYEHHRLICDETGTRLAKRNDALSLKTLRQSGTTPQDILTQLFP
ncbi:MAG: tRNA glutamyl-Q(34) synthetase GluQRS [Verrucomicrobiaceae bacterium]